MVGLPRAYPVMHASASNRPGPKAPKQRALHHSGPFPFCPSELLRSYTLLDNPVLTRMVRRFGKWKVRPTAELTAITHCILSYWQTLRLRNRLCVFPSRNPTSARLGDFQARHPRQSRGVFVRSRPPSRGCVCPRHLPRGLGLSHPSFASQRHQPAYAAVRPIAQPRYHPIECQRITPIDWVHTSSPIHRYKVT
jgi:hypothetical protein